MKRFSILCFSGFLFVLASPAGAGTKEEIMRLQNDVLALQNQLRLLDKSFNEQTQGLKSLVVQLNDQVGKSNLLLEKIAASLEGQAANEKSGDQLVAQELRNLSSKLDDTATRISALSQQIGDLKVRATPLPQSGFTGTGDDGLPLSADSLYNAAYSDLVRGNFDLAIEGFTAFVQNFGTNEKADDALYNIGEAYYNTNKLPQAITYFSKVLTDFPEGDRVASALFKRGKAELLIQERDNAIADFQAVLQKYPDTPEGSLARAELEKLGVAPAKSKTSGPARRRN